MLSEFLCECSGRLFSSAELGKQYATAAITPGKNYDGWWTAPDLLDQIKQSTMSMFEELLPDCIGVFVFDNSTNRGAFATDALHGHINLGSGGKQKLLRNGWFKKYGARFNQEMAYPKYHIDPNLAGKAKGVKLVLQERGLWYDRLKTRYCPRSVSPTERLLRAKDLVDELVGEYGHHAMFLPKFHCEFNFIEMYWGALKYFCRSSCDYFFAALRLTVDEAMDSVSLATIRRFARKCWRYMDAYQQDLYMEVAEWAVKKQRSRDRLKVTCAVRD
jgi:hypothetical protein